MKKLKEHLESIMELPSPRDWRILLSCFEPRVLKKNEFLIRQGHVCDVVAYVEYGLMRTQMEKNGTDFTIDFSRWNVLLRIGQLHQPGTLRDGYPGCEGFTVVVHKRT